MPILENLSPRPLQSCYYVVLMPLIVQFDFLSYVRNHEIAKVVKSEQKFVGVFYVWSFPLQVILQLLYCL